MEASLAVAAVLLSPLWTCCCCCCCCGCRILRLRRRKAEHVADTYGDEEEMRLPSGAKKPDPSPAGSIELAVWKPLTL